MAPPPNPPGSSPGGAPRGPGGSGVLAAGVRLAHYEVRRLLGEGAMGKVYEAHDTALDRPVALKVVHAELADDPDVAARFLEEPRAAARVVHENLAHVYFVGTTAPAPGAPARPFYAMELVPGATLEQRLAASGPLPLEEAVDALVQTARGLAAVHAAGLVHRDVKPANVLVTPAGRVKLTDFGLSKALGAVHGGTEQGSLVGTPDYMSPEQCRGQDVDARTDVYALGLTAFTLLTGRKPWQGAALGAVLDQQMNAPLPSAVALRPELPPAVDEVLARLTAKDRARRPAGAAEAVRLLESLRPRRLPAAPLVARTAAMLLDVLLWMLAVAGLQTALRIGAGWVGGEVAADAVAGVIALGLLGAMFPGMERRFGGSVGKLLLHLEVVRDDGARPSWATLLQRAAARFPFAPVLVVPDDVLPGWADAGAVWGSLAVLVASFLVAAFAGGRTPADLWTRTRVVYALSPR